MKSDLKEVSKSVDSSVQERIKSYYQENGFSLPSTLVNIGLTISIVALLIETGLDQKGNFSVQELSNISNPIYQFTQTILSTTLGPFIIGFYTILKRIVIPHFQTRYKHLNRQRDTLNNQQESEYVKRKKQAINVDKKADVFKVFQLLTLTAGTILVAMQYPRPYYYLMSFGLIMASVFYIVQKVQKYFHFSGGFKFPQIPQVDVKITIGNKQNQKKKKTQ